jgi:2-succinyl-5-enolpyruvyl-6-hydroxy-3-cyclohexene-1-carboxylate synthase
MDPHSSASLAEPAAVTGLFLRLFFDELQRSGVEHVCVSPGSRSTPLTVAAHRTAGLRCSAHLDERSAGFFALGLARRSRRPVVLICTSGTAVANYLPAVAEAHEARVPLIVLTADRPSELRDCGAGQTIDQLKIFGQQVKRFVEVAIDAGGEQQYRFARTLACRTVIEASEVPAGPVHLNWPLREPFDLAEHDHGCDELAAADSASAAAGGLELALCGRAHGAPFVTCQQGCTGLTDQQLCWLLACVQAHPRGVIACGSLEPDLALAAAICQLAEATGWPVLADPLSQLRCGKHIPSGPILAYSDWLLRDADFAADHRPDVVLRLGTSPVSKAQRLWLEAYPPRHLLAIEPALHWQQPSHLLSAVFCVDPLRFCQQLVSALAPSRHSEWRRRWQHADSAVAALLKHTVGNAPALSEARAVMELARLLPANGALCVSNSMPVRDVDAFLPLRDAPLDIFCNRGVNGIDGVLSTALGLAAGCAAQLGEGDAGGRGPVTLLIGDLALLHDLGALLTAHRLGLNLTIIVFNNDGGAIFSYLPIAAEGESVGFDELFTVAHGLEFSAVARQFGLSYTRVDDWRCYCQAVRRAQHEPGAHLIEVPVDADAAVRSRRELVQHVAGALRE